MIEPTRVNGVTPPAQTNSSTTADALIAENSNNLGVDARSLAADLTGLPPAERQPMMAAVNARLTPVQQGELARAVGELIEPPRVQAEARQMNFGEHLLDGVATFGRGVWSTVTGVASLAGNVVATAYDLSPAGLLGDAYRDATGTEMPGWLPSAERGAGRVESAWNTVRQVGEALWSDPSLLIREYQNLHSQGRYGALTGQLLADFGDLLLGAKGAGAVAGAAGDAGRLANGADNIADLSRLANIGDSAADLARLDRASQTAIDFARQAATDPAFATQSRGAMLQTRAVLEAVDANTLPPASRDLLLDARRQLDGVLGAPLPANAAQARVAVPNMAAGLTDAVLDLAAKSPSLMDDIRALEAAGWRVTTGPAGQGSTADRATRTITLDPNHVANPSAAVQVLAHEAGHAAYNYVSDFSSRDAFLRGTLADEGAATIENIRVQREIIANGGPDIGIAGNQANHATYNAIYDEMLATGDVATARQRIGDVFADNERASVPRPDGTNPTYREYYGEWYDATFPPAP